MAADVYVKRGVNKKLQEEFHCSELTVRLALNGVTDSDLARRIRASAIHNHGGRTKHEEKVVEKSN